MRRQMTEGKEGPGFVQLGIGDTVPNFTAQTQLGSITLWDFISGSWAVIVSFPADYSPVCTTASCRPSQHLMPSNVMRPAPPPTTHARHVSPVAVCVYVCS